MSFIAYDVTKELLVSLRPVVPAIAAHNKDLADQLYRAASSVLLNLAEGQKFQNGNRRRHYEIAHGSACQTTLRSDPETTLKVTPHACSVFRLLRVNQSGLLLQA